MLKMCCFWTLLSVGKEIAMEKGLVFRLSSKNKMHLHDGHRNKLRMKRVLEAGNSVRLSSLWFAFLFGSFPALRYTEDGFARWQMIFCREIAVELPLSLSSESPESS